MKLYLVSTLVLVFFRLISCQELYGYTQIDMQSSDPEQVRLKNAAWDVASDAVDEIFEMYLKGDYYIQGLACNEFAEECSIETYLKEVLYLGYSTGGLDVDGLIKQYLIYSLPIIFYEPFYTEYYVMIYDGNWSYPWRPQYHKAGIFSCDIIATGDPFKLDYFKVY
eukprot:TRINITY_DN3860_c0_g1_i5.p1 TRINITY_DN3860_c0_g1~~TRINITY_DN3860_c0_g1_i5.p1  ORF type:complete len:186 (-),score=6.71 TRINITY_DN3860_c0_g1_i5:321-818(-)